MNPFCPELTVWRPSCFHLPLPFEPRQSTALGLYSLRKGRTRYSCTSLQKLTARVIRLAHIAISFGPTYSFRVYFVLSVAMIPLQASQLCSRFRKSVALASLLASLTWRAQVQY